MASLSELAHGTDGAGGTAATDTGVDAIGAVDIEEFTVIAAAMDIEAATDTVVGMVTTDTVVDMAAITVIAGATAVVVATAAVASTAET